MKKISFLLSVPVLLLLQFGCGEKSQPSSRATPVPTTTRAKAGAIANDISTEFGKVSHVHDDGDGAPIIVFEENHGSVRGQIEEAIMLTRLCERYPETRLVLESYTVGDINKAAHLINEMKRWTFPFSKPDGQEVLADPPA